MYYISTLKQELGTARTYEHNLLDKKYIVDRYRCHVAVKFGVFVDGDHSKVSKGAKIRNQYNQVPHLTQDTNGEVTNSQFYTTNESQEVSTFPAGNHKAHINRRAQRHSKQKTKKTSNVPKRSTALERSVKYFTGGLKPV